MKKAVPTSLIIIFSAVFQNCSKEANSSLQELSLLIFRANQIQISGKAAKGVVRNAQVSALKINAKGECLSETPLAVTQSSSAGDYTLNFAKIGQPVCVRVSPLSGSTVYDEKSSKYIAWKDAKPMETILNESSLVSSAGRKTRSSLHLTPFSKIAVARIAELAKNNSSMENISTLTSRANREITIRFGLSGAVKSKALSDSDYPDLNELGASFENPDDPTALKMKMILAGISQVAYNTRDSESGTAQSDIDQVIEGFANDGADGLFDGKTSSGSSVQISGIKPLTLTSNSLADNLLPAVSQFISEGGSLSISPDDPKPNTPVTAATVSGSISFNGTAPITTSFSGTSTGTATAVTPSITYPSATLNLVGLSVIPPVNPIVVGTLTSFSISPALPAGMTFSTSTGAIGGTVPFLISNQLYTVTGTGTSGTVSASITIQTVLPGKRIFVTATRAGSWGAVASIDTYCAADANKPAGAGGPYKAMVGYSNGTRRACSVTNCAGVNGAQASDWVFANGTSYYRPDGTFISTATIDGILILPLTNSIGTAPTNVWTGMENTWGTVTAVTPECTGWTNAGFGNYGTANSVNAQFFSTVNGVCGSAAAVYCVEQ